MKRRSPAAPLLLPLVTFGIYALVWFVKTKNEVNHAVTDRVPTAWLLIVPFVNIWWEWKLAVSVEQATDSGMSKHAAFWLMLLLGSIGCAIVQNGLNKSATASDQHAAAVGRPVAV